jgi:hypothetical protein
MTWTLWPCRRSTSAFDAHFGSASADWLSSVGAAGAGGAGTLDVEGPSHEGRATRSVNAVIVRTISKA